MRQMKPADAFLNTYGMLCSECMAYSAMRALSANMKLPDGARDRF